MKPAMDKGKRLDNRWRFNTRSTAIYAGVLLAICLIAAFLAFFGPALIGMLDPSP